MRHQIKSLHHSNSRLQKDLSSSQLATQTFKDDLLHLRTQYELLLNEKLHLEQAFTEYKQEEELRIVKLEHNFAEINENYRAKCDEVRELKNQQRQACS
jgi:hypothetical protein